MKTISARYPGLTILITRYVDAAFPGFVECVLTDVAGKQWRIVEKVPVLTLLNLDANSAYPQPIVIACRIVARHLSPDGKEVVTVDTAEPYGIASICGETCFTVHPSEIEAVDQQQD
jgi:hypothetical protein